MSSYISAFNSSDVNANSVTTTLLTVNGTSTFSNIDVVDATVTGQVTLTGAIIVGFGAVDASTIDWNGTSNYLYVPAGGITNTQIANVNASKLTGTVIINVSNGSTISTNASFSACTITDLTASLLSCTTATMTNLDATNFQSTTATLTNLNATNFQSTTATISALNATNTTISLLTCTTATLTNLNATNFQSTTATISALNATNTTISLLTCTTATLTNLHVVGGDIVGLSSTNATVSSSLYAAVGTIATLNSTNATITTLKTTTILSTNGTITDLISTVATIAAINSTTINATNSNATNSTITNLISTTATFTALNVTDIVGTIATFSSGFFSILSTGTLNIADLSCTTATISNENVTNSTISNLTATIATITNLSNTNLTSYYSYTSYQNFIYLNGSTATITALNATDLQSTTATITTLNSTNLVCTIGTIGELISTTATFTTTSATTAITVNLTGTSATFTNLDCSYLQSSTGGTLTDITLLQPVIIGTGGTLGLIAGPDLLVGQSTNQTLTNKIISASNNTIENIGNANINTGALTNGQLFIGSTGNAPVSAGLTAGTNMIVTPSAGSIIIANTSRVLLGTAISNGSNSTLGFSSIPSTPYNHLELWLYGSQNTGGGDCNLQINGSSNASYDSILWYENNGGGVNTATDTGDTKWNIGPLSAATIGASFTKVTMAFYTSSAFWKVARVENGWTAQSGSNNRITTGTFQWRSTATISSILLTVNGGASSSYFTNGTTAYLYGTT